MSEEAKALPDLSEQIRRELERITNLSKQGIALRFDYDDDDEEEFSQLEHDEDEEEDENAVHLTALVEENKLILTSSTLPEGWGLGKEIILNGMRFCPFVTPKSPPPPPPLPQRPLSVLIDKANINSGQSPSSRKSPRRQDKENALPEEVEDKTASALKRRKSQDLTALVSPSEHHCGFLAKLTRHGTYADRWCELDPVTKTFNYWKTRAARGVCAPTVLPVADIMSVEWNAKDIREGKRRNIIGMGGARFVVTSKLGATTWRAKDPLVTLKWITGIQDVLDQIEQPAIQISESAISLLPEFERKCGFLQRMNAAGRYKDRWCELDAKRRMLSYWTKKSHWETQAGPKGVVYFDKVTSIVWNPDDVRKGKRRSLLSKDGVRFTLLSGNSAQNWRTNNPLDASEWSKVLATVLSKNTSVH